MIMGTTEAEQAIREIAVRWYEATRVARDEFTAAAHKLFRCLEESRVAADAVAGMPEDAHRDVVTAIRKRNEDMRVLVAEHAKMFAPTEEVRAVDDEQSDATPAIDGAVAAAAAVIVAGDGPAVGTYGTVGTYYRPWVNEFSTKLNAEVNRLRLLQGEGQ